MIQLPFSCYCSELKVNPKNWQSEKAPTKKDWFIYYRYYDPQFKADPKLSKGKLVIVKGMNHFKAAPERQQATKDLLQQELNKLKNEGYNPIIGKSIGINTTHTEVTPETPFLIALEIAEKRFTGAASTKSDIKVMLNQVSTAAKQIGYSNMPVKDISRKHIKLILLQIDTNLGENSHRYNKIRSYLMILYKDLVEMEAVEINPVRDLAKKKTIHKLRELPNNDKRKAIDEYLKEHQRRFWLFIHIFFHSGARLTELIMVKKKQVDLLNQSFIVTVKKGGKGKEVIKPIKNVALEYWGEAVSAAGDEDYIFSKGLMPGKVPIQSYQLTKRWNRHIKKKLNIKEDLYSLKHLNLDETAAILDLDSAAQMASHTTTAITLKHYALNESKRKNDKLKQVDNKFA